MILQRKRWRKSNETAYWTWFTRTAYTSGIRTNGIRRRPDTQGPHTAPHTFSLLELRHRLWMNRLVQIYRLRIRSRPHRHLALDALVTLRCRVPGAPSAPISLAYSLCLMKIEHEQCRVIMQFRTAKMWGKGMVIIYWQREKWTSTKLIYNTLYVSWHRLFACDSTTEWERVSTFVF